MSLVNHLNFIRVVSDEEQDEMEASWAKAEEEGRQAKAAGKSEKDNPYPDGFIKRRHWLKGFRGTKYI